MSTKNVSKVTFPDRLHNHILAQLSEAQYAVLARHLQPVELPLGLSLSEPNQIVEHAFFPTNGLISVEAITSSGDSVEVAVIGRDGMAGVCGLLAQPQHSHSVIVQGPGAALRIRTSVLREEMLRIPPLLDLIHQHIYMQMTQMSQSALCNRLHSVENRLARWLLTAADRMETDQLQLTQEFLAQMLGSRRSTVTVAAGTLQRGGLIDYSRGRIRITDRQGLETAACECYGIIRSTYKRLLGRKVSV